MAPADSSIALLEKQLNQLKALFELLLTEKETLQQHNPVALHELTEKKQQLLVDIESFDKTIGTNLQFLEDKKQGLIENELDAINQCLANCQEQNIINGQIINHSQLAVERMKSSLLERHNKSSITYDSKGKKSAGLSSLGLKA